MPFGSRGQSSRTSTPIVVLIIGFILILYILFLPPEAREGLLSGTPGSGGGVGPSPGPGPGPISGNVLIMSKYVGTLKVAGAPTVQHSIPTTTVFVREDTEQVKLLDSLLVKGGAFSNDDAELTFQAESGNSNNFLLTFNVDEAKGPLSISLNGQTIFEREVTSRSPEPIRLPKELIQLENTVIFSTGSTGWAFWDANVYRLRNIMVSADITRYDDASAQQQFTITPDEMDRFEKAVLEFVPECDQRQAGRLSATLNGELLYAGLIDCGVLLRQDVPKEVLAIGSNRLGFTSNKGAYTIDRIKLISHLEQDDYPVLYFNLPPDMWQQANVFAGRVMMTMRFTDGNSVKRGEVVINGFKDVFQTQTYYYQATLDPNILLPNVNSIQILPQGEDLNVAELRVELLG